MSILLVLLFSVGAYSQPKRSNLGADGENYLDNEGSCINPYVADGLVAMWDGEWNAGWGVHDDNASSWIDLISGIEAVPYNPIIWGECYLDASSGNTLRFPAGQKIANAMNNRKLTIEFLFKYDGSDSWNARCYLFHLRSPIQFSLWRNIPASNMGYMDCFSSSSIAVQAYFPNGFVFNRSVTIDDGMLKCYKDAILTLTASPSMNSSMINPITSIALMGDNPHYIGYVYNIRVYNRALTHEEIQYNYKIDKARFGL